MGQCQSLTFLFSCKNELYLGHIAIWLHKRYFQCTVWFWANMCITSRVQHKSRWEKSKMCFTTDFTICLHNSVLAMEDIEGVAINNGLEFQDFDGLLSILAKKGVSISGFEVELWAGSPDQRIWSVHRGWIPNPPTNIPPDVIVMVWMAFLATAE